MPGASFGQNAVYHDMELRFYKADKKRSSIKSLIHHADSLFSQNPDSAFMLYQHALNLSRKAGFDEATAKILVNLSSYYHNKGLLDKCISNCEEVLAMDQKKILKNDLARAFNNLGKAYSKKALYQKGIYYNQKAIAVIRDFNVQDLGLLGSCYNELGLQYLSLLKRDKALSYFDKAEAIFKLKNDSASLAVIYINQSLVYSSNNQNEKAIHLAASALDISKKTNNLQVAYRVNYILSRVYTNLGQAQKADSFFLQTVAIIDKMPDTEKERVNQYLLLAQNYKDTEDYLLAEKMYRITLEEAEKYNVVNFAIQNAHIALSALLARRSAFKEAYEHARLAYEMYIKFLNEKEALAAMDLEVKYQTLEKDKELAQKQLLIVQQQKKLQQKNFWIGGTSIGILLLATSIVTLYKSNRHKQSLQAASLLNLQQQQRIAQLQSKVEGEEQERRRIAHELHDGIVSQLLGLKLNIDALQGKKDHILHPYELNDVALQLMEATHDLRQTAHNLMPDLLLRQGLALSVAALCEKTSTNTSLEVTFQAYGSLPKLQQETELTLYRMIQELVQNTLKYAEATQLLVQLSCQDGSLNITVEDNGKGFPVAKLEQDNNEGMGLRNLKQRAEILKGHVNIQSKLGAGTTVYLEFDLNFLI